MSFLYVIFLLLGQILSGQTAQLYLHVLLLKARAKILVPQPESCSIYAMFRGYNAFFSLLAILEISPYSHGRSYPSRQFATLYHVENNGHPWIPPSDGE